MNARKLARRLHLWCGLSLGGLMVIIGLSGAALVYYVEIDRALHPVLDIKPQSPNWDQALETVRMAYPDKLGGWRFEVTSDKGAIPARYYNPAEKTGQGFAPMMVWLSPDGKQILRQDYWGDYLMTWLYNLHYQLLMGDTGKSIVGYLGLVTLVLLLSGLVSWWPKSGQWLKALRFKTRTVTIGLLYDWHKMVGLLFLLPLLLLSLTGAMLALPGQTDSVLSIFNSVSQPSVPQPVITRSDKEVITPSAAVVSALNALPKAQLAWIETPALGSSLYRLRLQVEDDPSRRFPHSYVYINAFTAKVESIVDYRTQGPSNTLLNWLHPLHDGTLFGHIGRIIWLLSGLSCLLLFVLGLWRWLLKRQMA